MDPLVDDILIYVLTFAGDKQTLARASETCKDMLKAARSPVLWRPHYLSFFPPVLRLTIESKHIGSMTYYRCEIGPYPGWKNVNDPITTKLFLCDNPKHYTNTIEVPKNVKFKNLFRACAKRTLFLRKKKLFKSNTPTKLRKIKRLRRELSELEVPIEELARVNMMLEPFVLRLKTSHLFSVS